MNYIDRTLHNSIGKKYNRVATRLMKTHFKKYRRELSCYLNNIVANEEPMIGGFYVCDGTLMYK